VIVVFEAVVPFTPPREWPQADAKIAWVDAMTPQVRPGGHVGLGARAGHKSSRISQD